jgi:hypothetical protein
MSKKKKLDQGKNNSPHAFHLSNHMFGPNTDHHIHPGPFLSAFYSGRTKEVYSKRNRTWPPFAATYTVRCKACHLAVISQYDEMR